jgi:hypothetical protein
VLLVPPPQPLGSSGLGGCVGSDGMGRAGLVGGPWPCRDEEDMGLILGEHE